MGSGGVTIAEKMKTRTIAYRRYFFRNFGLTSPILDRKKVSTGSSKTIPPIIISLSTKLIYSVILMLGSMVSVPMLKRKGRTTGINIK